MFELLSVFMCYNSELGFDCYKQTDISGPFLLITLILKLYIERFFRLMNNIITN